MGFREGRGVEVLGEHLPSLSGAERSLPYANRSANEISFQWQDSSRLHGFFFNEAHALDSEIVLVVHVFEVSFQLQELSFLHCLFFLSE